MYERMLDKETTPTLEEMTAFCGENAERFARINRWLTDAFGTQQRIVFPYGKRYGWGVGHYQKKKLICNIFAEAGAFTVMLRLSNAQFESVYAQLHQDAQDHIDRKYPCGDGGWIHFRVTDQTREEDIRSLLAVKCR